MGPPDPPGRVVRHWLSDLGGGFSVGLAYLLLAIWVIEVVFVHAPASPREADEDDPVLVSSTADHDRG